MRYELTLNPRAVADIEAIPLSLMDDVERELDRLAGGPVSASVRSAFPFPLNRQLFHFSAHDYLGKRWHFAVHFRYMQDEQTLYLLRVIASPPS